MVVLRGQDYRDANPIDVVCEAGKFSVRGLPSRTLGWPEVAAAAHAGTVPGERAGLEGDNLFEVAQSSFASVMTSLTTPLATLVLGRVASATQVAWFRVSLAPQQGLATLSAPARLILMTEQTRDWERGTRETVFAGIRRYMAAAALLSAVVLPPLLVFTPQLVPMALCEGQVMLGKLVMLPQRSVAPALMSRRRLGMLLGSVSRRCSRWDSVYLI